ncbi:MULTISPECIES: helix-turn-helix domain-containing protein [Burkholderiaceae]|uniref:helix-turn-helix domain-containing protein n=1 Tax=Burkholderiaceae TaxID=119060 RepID=UPI001610E3C6|nr:MULTISPECIES: helix-turn-helix domain-containing protein [Burkholderiaceae]MBB2981573.1 DNA-binding transcriptional MerR regulator [Paraburkholderia tropica]
MSARVTPITIQGQACLRLKDATAYLGLATSSKPWVWRKVQSGELHGLQDARGTWFVPVAELDSYLAHAADTTQVGPREAAELLDVSISTVKAWATRGVLAGTQDDRGRWSFARKTVAAHARALVEHRQGLTTSQAVRLCGFGHATTLNAAMDRGEVRAFVDASGRRRFELDELTRFLAERAKLDPNVPGTLSTREAADVLGFSAPSSIGWFAKRGHLDRVRVGRYWRYPTKSVQAFKRQRDKQA